MLDIETLSAIAKALADKFGWGVAILLVGAGSSGFGIAWVGLKALGIFQGWIDSREQERKDWRTQQESERRDWLNQIQAAHAVNMEAGTNCVKVQEGMLAKLSNIENNGRDALDKLEDMHKDVLRGNA